MTAARLTARGVAEQIDALTAMERRLADLTPAMEVVGESFTTFIDDRFESETDPRGNPWQELSDARMKQRDEPSPKILTEHSRLRNSRFKKAFRKSMQFGLSAIYGAAHHRGRGVPERQIVPAEQQGGKWRAITEGPAGRLWERARTVTRNYVIHGRLTARRID